MLVLFKSLVIQLFVFVCIFNAVSMLRETSMLSTNDGVMPEQHKIKTIMGDDIILAANGKKTIVYFFAPWCQICNLSINNLQEVYQTTPDLNVIAVALDYVDKEHVTNFTKNHQLTFPIAMGNETIKADFKVQGYPSYYVLDEQNTIVSRSLGYSSELGLYLRSF